MAKDKLKSFEYQGTTIVFEFGNGQKMVNATHMAKAFGKKVGNFLQNKQTKEFIAALNSRDWNSSHGNEFKALRMIKGGTPDLQGTWMDERLALMFAAWLSPIFHLWVYDRIHELLTTGKTELPQQRPPMGVIKSIRMIADQLEYQQLDIEQNKESIKDLQDAVGELDAKITSIDESFYTVSGYCNLNGILCPQEQARKWGIAATKLSHVKGSPVGKYYDAKFGEVNTYHVDILVKIVK